MFELIVGVISGVSGMTAIVQFVLSFSRHKQHLNGVQQRAQIFNTEALHDDNATSKSLRASYQWLNQLVPYASQLLHKQFQLQLVIMIAFLLALYFISQLLLALGLILGRAFEAWSPLVLMLLIGAYFFVFRRFSFGKGGEFDQLVDKFEQLPQVRLTLSRLQLSQQEKQFIELYLLAVQKVKQAEVAYWLHGLKNRIKQLEQGLPSQHQASSNLR